MEQTILNTTINQDTICAISTPAGVGGIAVARVSGPQAIAIVDKLWRGKKLTDATSHSAHLGYVLDSDGSVLDQGVATVFRAPRSFTGEDVVEISVHGSAFVQSQLINALIAAGCRLAMAGEFTRRAFASGKMDLAQAEAVADVIASTDRAAHRIAVNQMRGTYSHRLTELRDQLLELASLLELELDFSEEDVEFASRTRLLDLAVQIKAEVDRLAGSFKTGNAIKNGIPVAIVGATNAGKSSLLNALLGDDRAIVSDIHGTTRDIVEDQLRIGDYTFRIMDTAGLRHTDDTIENLGIERSLRAAATADIVISLVDATNPHPVELPPTDATVITVLNKIDLAPNCIISNFANIEANSNDPNVNVSAINLNTDNGSFDTIGISAKTGVDNGNDNSDSNGKLIGISTKTGADNGSSSFDSNGKLIGISAKTGVGIDRLRHAIAEIAAQGESAQSSVLVTNARHYESLLRASESISRSIDAIQANLSGDLIALDIRLTIDHLNSILGQITSSDILASIFSRFCIGK